jgi:hypothetical protein
MFSRALSGAGDGVDFVVVGFGLGAIMMLAGFALRDLGPWLFGSNVSERSLPEFEMVKTTIRKQTLASIGTGIATAGTGLALVTFAALLARTEDELGTIVVGMSLALAAVGVGAWSYDTVRRYRAAMDMVTHQEQTVLARISPDVTQRRTRPDLPPATVSALANDDEQHRSEELTPTEIDQESESQFGDHAAQATFGQDRPSQSDIAVDDGTFPGSASGDATSLVAPVQSEMGNVPDSRQLDEPEDQDSLAWTPPARGTNEPVNESNPDLTKASDERATSSTGASAPRWTNLNRSAESQPEMPVKHEEFTNLPPLPDEQHDKLIGEAVRFDFRTDERRAVPSWLFEDLETDLSRPGSGGQDDPVDQFHNSQPTRRGSALDRILAGDNAPTPDDSDEDEEALTAKRLRNTDDD